MTLLQFTVPPLPHYMIGGFTVAPAGRRHPSRKNIQVFDLLAVTSGCLYMGEEDRHYEVLPGHALILRPDSFHYATRECQEDTGYFWLHFQTTGPWSTAALSDYQAWAEPAASPLSNAHTTQTFTTRLPQFTKLLQPGKLYELLRQLELLLQKDLSAGARWKQQIIFQEVLQHLSASVERPLPSPSAACAEQAAAYLRQHYKEKLTAQQLGDHLNFHPVYIARCMQGAFGCSPSEYLLRYRIEQAKLLLLQTDLTISRIAEEVGFNQAAYFSSSFSKHEGIPPRKYRQRFSHG
ncbi:helix-turn-helix transcriptional regulator [Paenibacillus abyssi]|uniref:HTH-type transcriptional regulator YisR n=2 Tax=Paenibacillus abyssi TaxID=1340531 RepID=A0A917D107_9BACL|nr:helix-turn-helix domain-containing protein [Paenibacillus abyssi]GGG06471.1 putative HTH-type transcriptional regulator YisR [Paenibacillus abyssi]